MAVGVRVVSYNIHSGIGTDRRHDVKRIADVISDCHADIIGLQEVDVGRKRTGFSDQAHEIGERLGMTVHFHPALEVDDERYGDAILTKAPSRLVKAGPLPGLRHKPRLEPRGAIWVEVATGSGQLQVINTHFGLDRRERLAQVEALLGTGWLGSPRCVDPVLLIGDFNALPRSLAYRRLAESLADARLTLGPRRGQATFPSRFPLLRLDHAFSRGPINIRAVEVVRTPLARIASDHLPLVVDLDLVDAPPTPRTATPLVGEVIG
ncbi:endonuclease/exonuclease/phosphatase family protein [Consotaella aegiceratis]|uniref:endonuclease/exonuclease/phosphatase family protein n=1 Tax=Consotaella aegiceratis TaxID=3097961 RepID=UPI002F4142D7